MPIGDTSKPTWVLYRSNPTVVPSRRRHISVPRTHRCIFTKTIISLRYFNNVPCLLGELTCEDYGNPSCPDVFQKPDGDSYQCGSNDTLPNCRDSPDPLVSVVYVECVGFFGAFGIALAYLFYIQLASLLLGYCFYRCFCSKNDDTPNSMFQDMQEFVMTSMEK